METHSNAKTTGPATRPACPIEFATMPWAETRQFLAELGGRLVGLVLRGPDPGAKPERDWTPGSRREEQVAEPKVPGLMELTKGMAEGEALVRKMAAFRLGSRQEPLALSGGSRAEALPVAGPPRPRPSLPAGKSDSAATPAARADWLDEALHALLQSRTTVSRWPALVGRRVQERCRALPDWEYPPELLELAAEAAWTSPVFQSRFAQDVCRGLWAEPGVVLPCAEPPGQTWVPRLSHQALWTLIAMWPLTSPPGPREPRQTGAGEGLSDLKPSLREGLDRLKRFGRRVLPAEVPSDSFHVAEKWAGFWDQWFLGQSLTLGLRAAPAASVAGLPYLQAINLPFPDADRSGGERMADPRWESARPDFLRHYISSRVQGLIARQAKKTSQPANTQHHV